MGTEAWVELADAVAPAGTMTMESVGAALSALGLTPHQRSELWALGDRRSDPAGVMLGHLAASARDAVASPGRSTPSASATERAVLVADDVEPLGDENLVAALTPERTQVLVALPAARAGGLVARVLEAARASSGEQRAALADAAVDLARRLDPARLPVARLTHLAGAEPELAGPVALVLGVAPTERVLKGLAGAVHEGADVDAVTALLERVVRVREQDALVATAGGDDLEASPPPGPTVPPPLSADDPPVLRGGGGGGGNPGGRVAYPRIDLTTGTARADVVVVDRPFVVTVGLAPRPSAGIVRAGTITASGPIDVVLVYDPASLVPTGPTRHRLEVTDDDPYPVVDVGFTAAWLEGAGRTRRIGVHYMAEGQVVGAAWRPFVAAEDEASVASAPAPDTRSAELLDLSPLLGSEPPDLVLAVVESERGDDTFVWTAYSTDAGLPVPDTPDSSTIGSETRDFALDTRRSIQFSTDRLADFLDLGGRAARMGAAIPSGVAQAVRSLVAQEGRTTAPAVLLLTEELVVPWEIADLDLETDWGGTSPFLGAHVAVSRWPLTTHQPRPVPRASVPVERGAVVTADYTGVPGASVLEAATAEAVRVAALFSPAAEPVAPSLTAVIDLLRGTPPADVVHVALHGQFDATGSQEGIVLVKRDGAAVPAKQFLTPLHVENGRLDRAPFVFLNACQVGADKKVLGAYGGFASTLLRIGASSVVAPLWNIDDDVASVVADELYAQAWTRDDAVPVAEVLRVLRARYTEDAVRAGTAGVTATLVAFQLFGHPRLRLTRSGG